jgi:5-hydroxyisourate hydrolase
MAGGISIHVMDVVRGCPAEGMRVEILALGASPQKIAAGQLTAQGTLNDHPVTQGEGVIVGIYEVVFHVGDFYRQRRDILPELPFLDIVPFRFGISDVAQHYHLPMKVSPWGFSLFRGGS